MFWVIIIIITHVCNSIDILQWLNVFIVVGKRWVGWSNDSTGNKLDLVFEFNGFRTFKEVKIHSSHIPTRDVKVSVFHYLYISVLYSI